MLSSEVVLTNLSFYLMYLYYKRLYSYLCSAKAPVLEGSGSRRLYRRKGTSVDRVYVCLMHVSIIGFFFTIRQKRIRMGRSLKVTAPR